MPLNFIPEDKLPPKKSNGFNFIPEDEMPPEENPGILETIGNAFAPGLVGMTKLLAQNPKSLPSAAEDLVKSVPRAAADTVGNLASIALPFPYSDLVNNAAQSVPTPSPEASNALELAAGVIPIAKASEAIPEIAKLGTSLASKGGKALLKKFQDSSFVKNITGQNIEDATQKFGSEAKNVLGNLFGESKLSPIDQLHQGTRNVLSEIYPDAQGLPRNKLEQNTDEVLQKIYGTPDYKNMVGNENQLLSKKVQEAHDRNYAIGQKRFNKTLGRTPQEEAEEAKSKDDLSMPLLTQKITQLKKKPTLGAMHNVQSQIGSMIADMKSVPYNERDNEGISALGKLRDNFISTIESQAPGYKDDQAFWKNNVIPYYEDPAINKLVRKNVVPANISNILSKPELAAQRNQLPGTVNTVLSHLSPQDKQLIPAAQLSGTKANPLVDAAGNLNADKFAKNAQGLNIKNIQKFLSPDIRQKLIGLGQNLKDAESYDEITKEVTDNLGNVDPQKLVSNLNHANLSIMNPNQKSTLQNSLAGLNDLSNNAKLHNAITNSVQDLLGEVNPKKLVNNLKKIDPSLITRKQKAILQTSLSKLSDLSKNVEKQQEKNIAIIKLLKGSGLIASGLGIGEAARKIF